MGLVRFVQPPDGHGTVLGATFQEGGNPILEPSNAAVVVDFLPSPRHLDHFISNHVLLLAVVVYFLLSQLLLEDLAEPVPLGLLFVIGGSEPTVPESLTRSGAMGILEQVGDGILVKGVLFGVHALQYTGSTRIGNHCRPIRLGLEGGQEGLGLVLGAEPSHGDGDTEAARYRGVTDHRPGGAIDGVEAVFDAVFGVHVVNYTGTTENGKHFRIVDQNGGALF